MRVLHVSHTYPRRPGDGYGITMWDQIRALRTGQDVLSDVIAPVPWVPRLGPFLPERWTRHAGVPDHACTDGIEVVFPRFAALPKGLLAWQVRRSFAGSANRARRIAFAQRKYDLVHAHMGLPDGLAALRISRQMKCPLVVTMQCTDIDSSARESPQARRDLEGVFTCADQVISPSPRLAHDYQVLFDGSVVVVPYGIHAGHLHGDAGTVKASLPDVPIILCVARLIPSKGIDILLRSIEQLVLDGTALHVLVAGDGPSRAALRALASSLSLRNHVTFLGQLSHETVLEYMAACDVFVLPSWRETFGLVYLEAMAAGKPVIGVRGQGVDGIVEDGKTGYLVSPHSASEVTEVVRSILANPDGAREIGLRARELVLDQYTWEKCAERTLQVYREALHGR